MAACVLTSKRPALVNSVISMATNMIYVLVALRRYQPLLSGLVAVRRMGAVGLAPGDLVTRIRRRFVPVGKTRPEKGGWLGC